MKRENLTDELYCKKCGFLGKPEKFIDETLKDHPDLILCPQCMTSVHVVLAADIDWCEECQEQPQAIGCNLCAVCRRKSEEQALNELEACDRLD